MVKLINGVSFNSLTQYDHNLLDFPGVIVIQIGGRN